MTDRPIIFSAPMIRALLEGRKTQTRRLVMQRRKPAPHVTRYDSYEIESPWVRVRPGDRLWVREAHSILEWSTGKCHPVWYWADGEPTHGDWTKPRPSIHMPRWASRITLTVTEVRRQRVHEISEDDARAEGVEFRENMWGTWEGSHLRCGGADTAREAFRCLWINLHGTGTWDANPEVIVLHFSCERKNIDAQEAA